MKKFFIILLTALLFAACSKEDNTTFREKKFIGNDWIISSTHSDYIDYLNNDSAYCACYTIYRFQEDHIVKTYKVTSNFIYRTQEYRPEDEYEYDDTLWLVRLLEMYKWQWDEISENTINLYYTKDDGYGDEYIATFYIDDIDSKEAKVYIYYFKGEDDRLWTTWQKNNKILKNYTDTYKFSSYMK